MRTCSKGLRIAHALRLIIPALLVPLNISRSMKHSHPFSAISLFPMVPQAWVGYD